MTAALALSPTPAASPVASALTTAGFCFDGESWTHGDLRFREAGAWAILEQPLEPATELRELGSPGLWRTITESHCRVFELPATVLALTADSCFSDENPFAACLTWALATVGGKVADDWKPESRETIESIVPKNRLTVLAGASVRQGELIHTSQRLALRFPIVPSLPANVSETRLAHLHAALRDAQNTWSLVRLGLAGKPGAASVVAEIDFTGAPATALEPLFSAGLDALHCVISRFVETAEALSDATVVSAALDSAAFLKPSTKDPYHDHVH